MNRAQTRSGLRLALAVAAGIFLLLYSLWGALLLHYALAPAPLGSAAGVIFLLWGLAAVVSLFRHRWRKSAMGGLAGLSVLLLAWWSTLAPSNDRVWKPETAVAPWVEVDGDHLTFRNIRDFHYRSETDFEPAYYDRAFDMGQLRGVDLVASYWMGPHIAHIFVSFDFGEAGHLAVSIERRDEVGEGYSTLRGLFRQYELFYVVADERDLIGVRTNYRADPPEQVYLYSLKGTLAAARGLLLEYVKEINSLRKTPEFYNTLLTNCTTNIWMHGRMTTGRVPFSWKILASGHVPEYLYEQGLLDQSVPFTELQQASHINDRARAGGVGPGFSDRIRAGGP